MVETIPTDLQPIQEALLERLRDFGRVAVAYSGGVDSSLLLSAATEALGPGNALGILAMGSALTPVEIREAIDLARRKGFWLRTVEINELDVPEFRENSPERCYYCKRQIMSRLFEVAREEGITTLVDGSSSEDATDDYRPGMRAARELGVLSPLVDLGLRKDQIRALARARGLPNWGKPSAACLASRIPYGTPITRERLEQVGRAEAMLRERGFEQVRVRWHDTVARIEVAPGEIARFADAELRRDALEAIRSAGFRYVALDLQGYRTGSLNEGLDLAR